MSLGTTKERENLYDFAVDFLRSKKLDMVLDAACDDGVGTEILAKGVSGKIIGLDINPESIRLAKERYAGPNVSYELGDARKMRFADSSFDAVVSFHTIEHMGAEDQARLVKEFARILKPGGPLLVATPDHEVWKLQGMANMQEGHIKELTRKELEGVVSRNGFRVASAYGQFVLDRRKTFAARKVLNLVKKMDVFRLRRLVGKKTIDAIDRGTQPVQLNDAVVPLAAEDKASVNVLVCQRA